MATTSVAWLSARRAKSPSEASTSTNHRLSLHQVLMNKSLAYPQIWTATGEWNMERREPYGNWKRDIQNQIHRISAQLNDGRWKTERTGFSYDINDPYGYSKTSRDEYDNFNKNSPNEYFQKMDYTHGRSQMARRLDRHKSAPPLGRYPNIQSGVSQDRQYVLHNGQPHGLQEHRFRSAGQYIFQGERIPVKRTIPKILGRE